jgi:glycerophosphoryl diester phosphodiesterase
VSTTPRGDAAPPRTPRAPARRAPRRPSRRAPRPVLATLTTIATALVLVLAPGVAHARAGLYLGPLRSPGEPAFIAAHRGDRASAPENTLAAFRAAITGGSDILETDVRLTADGVAVLLHDETVDRTTDGTGAVADLTLAEVRALDAGSWFDDRFVGEPVPLFTEFLDLVADSGRETALIELKGHWDPVDVERVILGIYLRGVQDRVVFASFEPTTLRALREVAPDIPRAMIRRVLPVDPVKVAERFGVIAIMTRPSALAERPDVVPAMHAAGLGILLYTLNSEDRWSKIGRAHV